MKTFHGGTAVFALLLSIATNAVALPKYANWARTPSSGAAIAHAAIRVVDAQDGSVVSLFDGTGAALANPFTADASGYFEFYAANGAYDVIVSPGGGCNGELDRFKGVVLVDPQGPQTVCANADGPAVTVAQPAADVPVFRNFSDTSFGFERQDSAGERVGAPWYLTGYRAEQGLAFFYNTFGRHLNIDCQADDFAQVSDRPTGDGLYVNSADHGDVFFGGNPGVLFDWFGAGITNEGQGGVWLPSTDRSTVNVEFAVAGTAPTAGQVVALSATAGDTVALTTATSARAPFVVTGIRDGKALVAVAGVADVRTTGKVSVGDALVTSGTRGIAKAQQSPLPGTTLGIALGSSSGSGTVRARIGLAR